MPHHDEEGWGGIRDILFRKFRAITPDSSTAEDMAQVALTKLYEHPHYRLKSVSVRLKIGYVIGLNYLRTGMRRESHSLSTQPDPVSADREESRRYLRDSIDCLRKRYQRAVTLHFLEQYTYAEIASLYRVPASTVRNWCARGIKDLRRLLGSD
jgi:RNA polymerase sigma factor (sigma-70 family)